MSEIKNAGKFKTGLRKQFTINKEVSLQGRGLHSGEKVEIILKPLPAGSGINFDRSQGDKSEWVKASPENAISTRRGVELGCSDRQNGRSDDEDCNSFMTVEHLMAACAGLKIDNLLVEVRGPEIPVGDGSAIHLVELLQRAGRRALEEQIEYFEPADIIKVSEGESRIYIRPASRTSYHYKLDYDQDPPGQQHVSFFPGEDSFSEKIAPARTFILQKEIENIRKSGLGRGGSRDNVVVYGEEGPKSDLRFVDEAARHKLLDLLGDLFMAGHLLAEISAVKSGHSLHQRAAEKISLLQQKED